MSYLTLIMLLIGVGCLVTEVFIPGFGVFGITGIIMLVASSVLTLIFIPFGLFFALAEIVIIFVVCCIIFNYIRKNQLKGKIILDETLNFEKKELGNIDYFIGKEGITKTTLRPFGSVDFNGIVVDAYSDGDFIPLHQKVIVVNIKENKIYVKRANQN